MLWIRFVAIATIMLTRSNSAQRGVSRPSTRSAPQLVPAPFRTMEQTLAESHIPFPYANAIFVSLV